MGTPVVANGFRMQVRFAGTAWTRPWSTKFDYLADGDANPQAAADAFAAAFDAAQTEHFTTGIPFAENTVLEEIACYRLADPLTGAIATTTPTLIDSGSAPLPAEVAIVSTLRTPILGRGYRGRQYWGSIGQAQIPNGVILPAVRNTLQAFVTELMTFMDSGDFTYVLSVMRRTGEDNEDGRYPAEAVPVTTVTVDQYPDTQRRRGPRG